MKLQGEEKGWWKVEMKELRKEPAKYGGREMKRRTGQGGKRRAEEGVGGL